MPRHVRELQRHVMSTILSPIALIQCLAGELLVDPALLLETILTDKDLARLAYRYRDADLSYEDLLTILTDYI